MYNNKMKQKLNNNFQRTSYVNLAGVHVQESKNNKRLNAVVLKWRVARHAYVSAIHNPLVVNSN